MKWMNDSTVEELKKTRNTLNTGALEISICFAIFMWVGLLTWVFTSLITLPIAFFFLAIIMLILFTLYILKRDMRSIAILLKEMKP